MELWVLKLLLTPVLIAGATLAARRWGAGVGGWLAGLPLTSGPVSIFLALEQGPPFAAQAANGTLLGLIGVASFCVVYATIARAGLWHTAALCGFTVFLMVTWLVWDLTSPPIVSFAAVLGVLLLASRLIPIRPNEVRRFVPVRWDLRIRIVVATTLVVGITAGASVLGPQLSGLLSPFPVFAAVMATFAHHQGGAAAAAHVLRGVVMGSFAFAAFFVVVSWSLGGAGLVATYACATAAAIVVHSVTLTLLMRHRAAVAPPIIKNPVRSGNRSRCRSR